MDRISQVLPCSTHGQPMEIAMHGSDRLLVCFYLKLQSFEAFMIIHESWQKDAKVIDELSKLCKPVSLS